MTLLQQTERTRRSQELLTGYEGEDVEIFEPIAKSDNLDPENGS